MPQLSPIIRSGRIQGRVTQLGRAISQDYAIKPPLLLPLLDGAVLFAADLMRAIRLPGLTVEFARASSWHGGMQSSGSVELGALPDVRGRDVLIVDDILDSGRTLVRVRDAVLAAGAERVRSCVCCDKPGGREVDIQADYVGFVVPTLFLVGYGLDYDGRYRHLPDICHYREDPSPSSA